MRFSIITSLFAASSALAAPAPVSKVTRDGLSVLEFQFCNQCTTSCAQTHYMLTKTEGDGGHGDCNTPPTALKAACDSGSDIPTPFGTASYTPLSDCSSKPEGDVVGHIFGLKEGGGVFRYSCVSVYEQFTIYCGFTFACNTYLTCTQG